MDEMNYHYGINEEVNAKEMTKPSDTNGSKASDREEIDRKRR